MLPLPLRDFGVFTPRLVQMRVAEEGREVVSVILDPLPKPSSLLFSSLLSWTKSENNRYIDGFHTIYGI